MFSRDYLEALFYAPDDNDAGSGGGSPAAIANKPEDEAKPSAEQLAAPDAGDEPEIEDKPQGDDSKTDDAKAEPITDPVADYTAIQGKVDKGEPLTTEEKTRLQTYDRRIEEYQAQEAREAEKAVEREAKLKTLPTDLKADVIDALKVEMKTATDEGRGVSETILDTAIGKAIEAKFADAADFVIQPYADAVRNWIGQASPSQASKLAGANIPLDQLISNAIKVAQDFGKSTVDKAKDDEIASLKLQVKEMQEKGEKTTPSADGERATARGISKAALGTDINAWLKAWDEDPKAVAAL